MPPSIKPEVLASPEILNVLFKQLSMSFGGYSSSNEFNDNFNSLVSDLRKINSGDNNHVIRERAYKALATVSENKFLTERFPILSEYISLFYLDSQNQLIKNNQIPSNYAPDNASTCFSTSDRCLKDLIILYCQTRHDLTKNAIKQIIHQSAQQNQYAEVLANQWINKLKDPIKSELQDLTKNQPDPVYSLFNSIPSSDPVLQNIKQEEEVLILSKFTAIKAMNQEIKKASQENIPSHPQQSSSSLYSLLNNNIPIDNENSAITLVHDANGVDPGNGFLIIENMEKNVRSINLYRIDIYTDDVVFTNEVLDEQKFYNEMMSKNCYAVTCSVPKNEKIKFDIINSGGEAERNTKNFTTGNKTFFQGDTGKETAFKWARSMFLKFSDDRPVFNIHSGVSSFKKQQQTKNITSDIFEKTNNSKEGFKNKIQSAVDSSEGAALLSMLTNKENRLIIDHRDISYEAKDVILNYIKSTEANYQDKESFCEGLDSESLLKDLFEKKARYFRSPQPDRGHLKEALDLKNTFEEETGLTRSSKR